MEFTVYNLISGRITKVVSCAQEDLILQVGDGESAIIGWSNDITQIVVDGVVVDKPIEPIKIVLEDLKSDKAREIKNLCQQAIVSGFLSNALGSIHLYPSKQTDQLNLIACVTDSYNPDNNTDWTTYFWCSNSEGKWNFVPHTAAQIRMVGADGKTAISQAIIKNTQLQAQILEATTQEELNAIIW